MQRGRQRDEGARGAAAAAPGGLPPGAGARPAGARLVEGAALVEALENAAADGHKALVFSQWTSLLDSIEPRCRSADIAFDAAGRLDARSRRGDARFQAPDGPPVMLISLKAGGTRPQPHRRGSRLPGGPVVEPRGRGAGRGPRPPHRPGAAGVRLPPGLPGHGRGADPRLQDKKRALFEAALGDGGGGDGGLTRDDLLELFR